MSDKFSFQYCQKIVIFSVDKDKVLLCRRKGEADYDGVFSFIGGKMETSDSSLLEGLKREKDEELGEGFQIKIFPDFSTNILFTKKDGSAMILPHYYAVYESGDVALSEEYSNYEWVGLEDLESFEPKVPNIPEVVSKLLELRESLEAFESVII